MVFPHIFKKNLFVTLSIILGFTLNCILAQLTSNILFSCSLIPVDVLGHSESEKYIVKVSFDDFLDFVRYNVHCGNT